MITRKIKEGTSITRNTAYPAEPLERKIAKMLDNKEPIDSIAPMIYTERKMGVQPQYNIRTDRWEVAREAMGKVSKTMIAKAEEKPETEQKPETENNKN